MKIIHPKL